MSNRDHTVNTPLEVVRMSLDQAASTLSVVSGRFSDDITPDSHQHIMHALIDLHNAIQCLNTAIEVNTDE